MPYETINFTASEPTKHCLYVLKWYRLSFISNPCIRTRAIVFSYLLSIYSTILSPTFKIFTRGVTAVAWVRTGRWTASTGPSRGSGSFATVMISF